MLTILGLGCMKVSVTFKVLLPTLYPSVFRSWWWGTCNRASVVFWKKALLSLLIHDSAAQ